MSFGFCEFFYSKGAQSALVVGYLVLDEEVLNFVFGGHFPPFTNQRFANWNSSTGGVDLTYVLNILFTAKKGFSSGMYN